MEVPRTVKASPCEEDRVVGGWGLKIEPFSSNDAFPSPFFQR